MVRGRQDAIWAQYRAELKSTRRITRNPGHHVNMFQKFQMGKKTFVEQQRGKF